MRDRYIPPFEIKTLEQLIRVFGSWNHHAEPGGAWRLYSKEEHDDSPSRRDGVSADIEARYKKLLVTLIWKVAEALNSYASWVTVLVLLYHCLASTRCVAGPWLPLQRQQSCYSDFMVNALLCITISWYAHTFVTCKQLPPAA